VQIPVQRIERWLVDGAVLPELGVEPLERFEVVPLLRVVDRFAEIPVARGRSFSRARRVPERGRGQADQ
jgi:hypothetical protein